MIFVALDLETTGLDTTQDTIIEIAAIRFQIEKVGNIYTMTDIVEHSQLIHPGRPLTQEISMITGITGAMLEGRPSWETVQEKVREFIGDAIIVGHNVLFDIAVLRSHGIDLSQSIVIDTFELSEIFSQDVESLNLGFLADRYGLIDPSEAEHRALTDTRVAIRLFLRYLGEIGKIEGAQRQIWDTLSSRDESRTLATLSGICHGKTEDTTDITQLFADLLGSPSLRGTQGESTQENSPLPLSKRGIGNTPTLIQEINNSSDEITLIEDTLREKRKITLVTPGYKVANWMSKLLGEKNIENMIAITYDKWCSIEHMREIIGGDRPFSRKEMILTLKIMYWMTETSTGLLDEMKFYGDERNMIDSYRCKRDEFPIWRKKYESTIDIIPVVICDAYNFDRPIAGRYTIIKDLPLLEDIVRKRSSQKISFDQLYATIVGLPISESRIHIADMISMIRGIYESIPERPTGINPNPPGDYGETYFITQAMLWHRGYRWLVHATEALDLSWKQWKREQSQNLSREVHSAVEYIDQSISRLYSYHQIQDLNNNVILNITNEQTQITFIPRSVSELMRPILDSSLSYGTNLSGIETASFLMREYGINTADIRKSDHQKIGILSPGTYHAGVIQAGTVILTTSLKHARDIGSELRKIHGKNQNILIQGLSGGKGKMLSLFTKNTEKTILIGIIDTWRDEYSLWQSATDIIIAKLPFDPPTDPYFLARTVGMSNNFSDYSGPIVTIRLNALIERIRSSGYQGSIHITDPRLTETEWGKKIKIEIL